MKTTHNLQLTAGFTIIEAFVAISILLVAITGPLSIVTKGLSASIYAKEQMIAAFLAQEATEYIRNQRDTNVLAGSDWLDGVDGSSECGGAIGCTVDVQTDTIAPCSGACPVLRHNPSTGAYGYGTASGWRDSLFTRTVRVTEEVDGVEAEVVATVLWRTGLIAKTITVRDRFFNWQE